MPEPSRNPQRSVFINCPFDENYTSLFRAIVFSVFDCGYFPRCGLELEDSGDIRLTKLVKLMEECPLGIHDISETESSGEPPLPRFNMPFELGLFLGAKYFGNPRVRNKKCLILDLEAYRYHRFISDIKGQDIEPHEGDPEIIIKRIRNWLRSQDPGQPIPGASAIVNRYRSFSAELGEILEKASLVEADVTFIDLCYIIYDWLEANP